MAKKQKQKRYNKNKRMMAKHRLRLQQSKLKDRPKRMLKCSRGLNWKELKKIREKQRRNGSKSNPKKRRELELKKSAKIKRIK